jgi:hypothetical protein
VRGHRFNLLPMVGLGCSWPQSAGATGLMCQACDTAPGLIVREGEGPAEWTSVSRHESLVPSPIPWSIAHGPGGRGRQCPAWPGGKEKRNATNAVVNSCLNQVHKRRGVHDVGQLATRTRLRQTQLERKLPRCVPRSRLSGLKKCDSAAYVWTCGQLPWKLLSVGQCYAYLTLDPVT